MLQILRVLSLPSWLGAGAESFARLNANKIAAKIRARSRARAQQFFAQIERNNSRFAMLVQAMIEIGGRNLRCLMANRVSDLAVLKVARFGGPFVGASFIAGHFGLCSDRLSLSSENISNKPKQRGRESLSLAALAGCGAERCV